MNSVQKVIILGTGGNCIDILDTLHDINETQRFPRYACIGFLDDNPTKRGQELNGIKVIGRLVEAPRFEDCLFINGLMYSGKRSWWGFLW